MRGLTTFLLLLLLAIPVFAVFLLLRRLETTKRDPDADRKFYEALRAAYYPEEEQKKPRALSDEEKIALARRIAENPDADITAGDIIAESPDPVPEEASPENAVSEKADSAIAAEAPEQKTALSDEEKREKALALVSGLLGSSGKSGKDKKDKGASSRVELEIALAKYRSEIEKKQG